MTSDDRTHFDALGPEERDALLSAYALGELEGAELALVERLLADPAADEARRVVADSRAVAAALRTARAEDVPPRSADLRRAVVAALAAPGAAAPSIARGRSPKNSLPAWLALAGALAATVLVSLTVVPAVRSPRDIARRPAAAVPTGATSEQQLGQDDAAPRPAAPATRSRLAMPRAAAPGDPAAGAAEKAAADAGEMIVTVPSVGRAAGGFGGRVTGSAPASAFGGGNAPAAPTASFDDRRLDTNRLDELRADGKDAVDREKYPRFEENRFLAVADRPLSTFSIDVDTASYAVVRRFLASGRLPPADAVRIEEFVNSFRYAYPQPDGDDPFAVALEAADCPWRPGHRLVRIGIAGRDIDRARRPSGNLVFLVDVSGSMDEPDKLPLVKRALAMLVAELTENDRVSIVTYAGDASVKLPPTSGDQKRTILDVVESLAAGGATHGSAGIELAYAQAREGFIAGGANRVILCTDGDLNVGVTSDAALVDLITDKARGGTFLTVLGFGQGNLQDEKMERLADEGNGVYAYVDGVREARKVLVEQLTGSTITIAKDVKIQVEFNPAQVASYRLLGYENRRLADADFRDDTKDAGEIGAGHTVTAVYEIVPVGGAAEAAAGPGAGAEPLTYRTEKPGAAEPSPAGPASAELLTVKLRYKQPEGTASVLREFPLADSGGRFEAASIDTRFAAAVAAFGMLLRGSEFEGDATFATVAKLAGDALGPDEGGYRAEFLDLVRKTETIKAGEHR